MEEPSHVSRRWRITLTVLGLIALIAIAVSTVLFRRVKTLENPDQVAADKLAEVVADIGQDIILPTSETPTLATVSDPSKLSDQPFFAHAQTGDEVLIYTKSQKAILWRPSIKKIVEVSGLNVSTPVPSQ